MTVTAGLTLAGLPLLATSSAAAEVDPPVPADLTRVERVAPVGAAGSGAHRGAGTPAGPVQEGRRALAAAPVAAAVPATPAGLPGGVEALSPYLEQVSCNPVSMPGSVALGDLLRATYPGTSYGIGRECGADGMASEHYEGRAVDWFVSVRDPLGAARAEALIDWLLAPDAAGHTAATARRLGIMYLIWDNRIWGAYRADEGWRPYSSCALRPGAEYDTGCHRDHIHISLSWAGAAKHTSFWTRRVAATDYGPCPAEDLNWAAPYSRPRGTPCPDHSSVGAQPGDSAVVAALVRYSGATVGVGSSGPVVRAVQAGVGVTVDGGYGPITAGAVAAVQRTAGVPASGRMDAGTWRAVIAARRAQDASGTTPSPRPSPPPKTTPPPAPANPLGPYARTVLHYGDSGAAVVALQRALGVNPASGWFGPLTRSTVTSFQRSKGLVADGVVGPATWRALGAT